VDGRIFAGHESEAPQYRHGDGEQDMERRHTVFGLEGPGTARFISCRVTFRCGHRRH